MLLVVSFIFLFGFARSADSNLPESGPFFFCAYACEGQEPTESSECLNECPSTDKQDCPMVPKLPPFFPSRSLCEAFAAMKPRCHVGGSCYVSGRPEFPALPQGFDWTGDVESAEWRYGVSSSTSSGTSRQAVDPLGKAAFHTMQTITSMGDVQQAMDVSSLLLGTEGRLYTLVNVSGQKACTYTELSREFVDQFVAHSADGFSNWTWLEDAEVDGELVHVFGMVPNLPPTIPVFAHLSNQGLLHARPSDMFPLRSMMTSSVDAADWDQAAGFQGIRTVQNTTSFIAGRPPAELFQVPKAWQPCQRGPAVPLEHFVGAGAHPAFRMAVSAMLEHVKVEPESSLSGSASIMLV